MSDDRKTAAGRGDAPGGNSLRRSLRKRLAAATPGAPPAPKSPGEIVYSRDLPRTAPQAPQLTPMGPHVPLETAAPGREVRGDSGFVWLVEKPVSEIDASCAKVCRSYRKGMLHDGSPIRRLIAERCELAEVSAEETVFVDLETTGLGSSPLFLIGTLLCEGGRLVVRQFFARDYAEERAVISMFLDLMAGRKLLVSFNGKSFDLPYVRVRAAATGLAFDLDPGHLDLLHVSRRLWKHRMPDCRLQTLERQICGRYRSGDIPGHLIPQAYHDFVRTGNARQMADCLKHNMLDLVTLADLAARLPEPP